LFVEEAANARVDGVGDYLTFEEPNQSNGQGSQTQILSSNYLTMTSDDVPAGAQSGDYITATDDEPERNTGGDYLTLTSDEPDAAQLLQSVRVNNNNTVSTVSSEYLDVFDDDESQPEKRLQPKISKLLFLYFMHFV